MMNTSTTTLSSHCSGPAPAWSLIRTLLGLRESIRHRFEIHAMHLELISLDERILRDIGLTRNDLIRSLDVVAAERRESMDLATMHSVQRRPRP